MDGSRRGSKRRRRETCAREHHQSTSPPPPSTHSARRIRISRSIRTISQLYTRPTSAISTRSASFHLALRLSRPRSRLIEVGRREMLRGNFSNRAREVQRRKEKLAYLLSLVFSPLSFRVFLYRNSIFIFIADFSSRFHLSGYRDTVRSKFRSVSPFFFLALLCSLVIAVPFDRFIFS